MKPTAAMFALVFSLSLFGASCATVSRLNEEFEEEMTRIESLSPEQKAELEKNKREEEKIEMRGYFDNSDNE